MYQRFKPTLFTALVFSLSFAASKSTHAQEKIPFVNSTEVLTEAVKQYEEGSYKASLKLLKSIPEGDTNYRLALSEQVLVLLADSNFTLAKSIAQEALQEPEKAYRRQFMLFLGHAYDYTGHADSALACYDQLINWNAYDHQPWYEKGATYFQRGNYEAAMACFRHSMVLNPYHFRTHYMVGSILALQGRLSEAYLAYCTALFTSSDASMGKLAIRLISNIANQNDEMAKAYRNRKQDQVPPAYEEIDEIISAKLPLSKDYKFKSDLAGDGIVNDLHAILEKVQYTPGDTSLVMQYYVPLYSKITAEGNFDPMVLYMFSGYEIKQVEDLAKRNKSAVQELRQMVVAYLNRIAATGVIDYTMRQKAKQQYAYITEGSVFVIGNVKSTDPFVFGAGKATIYKAGELAAEGSYNDAGKKEGTWHYYRATGQLRSTENNKNGVSTGTSTFYNENGTLNSAYKFDGNGKTIEEQEYTSNGTLSGITTIDGASKQIVSLHANGQKEFTVPTLDKKVKDGHYQYLYDNGKVHKDFQTLNGERTGVYKEYFRNGQLAEESNYKNDVREGAYTSYFKNGKVHYKASYKNNKLEGPFEEWTDLGVLDTKGNYHHDDLDGISTLHDHEGKPYATVTYDGSVPTAYEYKDQTGKIVGSSKKFETFVSYFPNGNMSSEIPYKNGKINGLRKTYYPTGSLHISALYKDGAQDGETVTYYHHGGVKSRLVLKNDVEDGYYQSYFPSGKLQTEGWLKEQAKQGTWKYYNSSGTLDRVCFYQHNVLNGPCTSYFENGRKDFTDRFSNGMIVGIIEYDSTGKERRRADYPLGNGIYSMTYFNGKTRFQAPLKNGNYHGQIVRNMPNGALLEKAWITDGDRDSLQEVYNSNGSISFKATYDQGLKNGPCTYYNNGIVRMTEDYVENEEEGLSSAWEEEQLRYTYNYHHGNLEGIKTVYGDNKQAVCMLHFEDDELMAYTAMDKDGKMSALVPVKNGSCSIVAYYGDGKKAAEINYKDGLLDAHQAIYYANGQMASERNYAKSELNGPFRRWFPDGKPSYESTYLNNELVGKETAYNKEGKIIAATTYLEGGVRHGEAIYLSPATQKPMTVSFYYGLPLAVN